MKWIIVTTLIILLISPSSFAAKKHCKPYLAKLNKIKSVQRQGHSLKKANRLAEQERKARKKWWQCETGKIKAKNKKR